jgi:nitroreductase
MQRVEHRDNPRQFGSCGFTRRRANGNDGPMEFDLEQTDALLSTTRAVRKRLDLDREVPDDVLLECLQLAVQAPTGSNQQGWRWMVVRDAEKKQALADIYSEAGGEYLASAAEQADKASQQGRVIDSANFLAQNMGKVPVLLIPLIIGRLPDNSANAAAGLMGSIMPAMWSFQLALRSRGLGSCLTTLHLAKEQEAADLLAIPDHMTQAGLIPVAYTKGTDFKPAQRDDVAKITYLDTYKNPIRPT